MYVASKKAREKYKVSEQTLRNWAEDGRIEFETTPGGHRRYKVVEQNDKRKSYVYARVSSRKQEGDLQRQVEFLRQRYPDHEVITDIGSGINNKRKGFQTILEQLFRNNVKEVVVSSGDRFSRFGTDLFEWMFEQHGAKLKCEHDKDDKTHNEELADDLMEIITVFSARYHGSRKYKTSKEDEDLPERPAEETI
jgi:predicted site-specific integrase-resolvase